MKINGFIGNSPSRGGWWRWIAGTVFACVAVGALSMLLWGQQWSQNAEFAESPHAESEEPIQPIEPLTNLDSKKVALGRKLFNERLLSHNNDLSCASCHILETGGSDRRAKSIGMNGAVGSINSPTVLNSAFNFSQFWDGRAETLEKQAGEPILSKVEMGSTWPEVIGKLNASPGYVREFAIIYKDGIQSRNVQNSIAEFERSLSTPNSRFDRFLKHDARALDADEQKGYALFKSFGCASCHQGANVGGNMYQKMGVMAPYFADRGQLNKADMGRFNLTGEESDRFMFKVPSLRNVSLTAPYFHDGSALSLTDAVTTMARYQLGHPITDLESNAIVAFLKTLTGELNGRPL